MRSAVLAWLVLLALVLYTLEGPTGPRACKRLLSTANAAFAVQRQMNGYSVLPTGGLGTAAALPYAYMYALYVCLICMPDMYALHVCLIQYALYSKPYMYALYVCLICMPYMYYNMPYMSAIYALYRIPCIGLGAAAQLCYKLCTCCTCRALNSMSTVDYGLAWLCGVWCVVCGVLWQRATAGTLTAQNN